MVRIFSLICCAVLLMQIVILGNVNNLSNNTTTETTIESNEVITEYITEATTVIETTIMTEPPVQETEQIEVSIPEETTVEIEQSTEETTIPTESIKSYTDDELYILSHLIYGEASGCSWDMQIGVGSVVLNRVKDSRYPNTIKGVVFDKGQYACTWDGNYNKNPDQQAIDVAIYLLENGSQYPEYVIFQSQFVQGDSVYQQIGNTYFCYWSKDVK